MFEVQPDRDARGHHPDCTHYGDFVPLADENSTHVDVFCDCHRFIDPMILSNGTDIAWPSTWGQNQADKWRKKNGLARPSEPGSGP
jgi:hypothetical protein